MGLSPMIPYTCNAYSTQGSGVLFLWFPGINTQADMGLAFRLVKREVSPRAFGGNSGAVVSSSRYKYSKHMSDCKMEDLVLQMDSAIQKHLSPLLITLISWNYEGKCNNSWSSFKKYPGIQRRVILRSSGWSIRIVSYPSKSCGLPHTMVTFKLSSATEQQILCNSLSSHFKAFHYKHKD